MKTKGNQPRQEPLVSMPDVASLHVASNGERVTLCSNQVAYLEVLLVAAPGSIQPVVEHFATLLAERYNLAPQLVAALAPVAQAAKQELCKSDPSGTVTLAECMDEKGEDTFTIKLTLKQANAIADVLARANLPAA